MGRRNSAAASRFFFFQAEDGIRDYKVTGVQTCALPIYAGRFLDATQRRSGGAVDRRRQRGESDADRKSTRLNSSHLVISYAVFCLKKKNKKTKSTDSTQRQLTRRIPE